MVNKEYVNKILVFDGGLLQALGANSAEDRDSWLQALQLASYDCMRSQLLALRQRIEAFSGHKLDTDIQMLRLQRGISTGSSATTLTVPPRSYCLPLLLVNNLVRTLCRFRSRRNTHVRDIFGVRQPPLRRPRPAAEPGIGGGRSGEKCQHMGQVRADGGRGGNYVRINA